MALSRMAMARSKDSCILAFTRWTHGIAAHPPPLATAMTQSAVLPPPLVLPEYESSIDTINNGIDLGFYGGIGSMELMAVPKKKTSPPQTWDKKWTEGSETYSSDHPLQGLWAS